LRNLPGSDIWLGTFTRVAANKYLSLFLPCRNRYGILRTSLSKIGSYFILISLVFLFLLNCHTRLTFDYKDKNSPWYLPEEKVKILQDSIIQKFYLPVTANDHIIYARYSVEEGSYKQDAVIYKIDFSGRKEFYVKSFNSNPQLHSTTSLAVSELKKIVHLFHSYHFHNIPPVLPLGQANVQLPSFGVIIAFSEKAGTDLKIIEADMTADYQYYPERFFPFTSQLEKVLRDLK
jgi:hypothetical protein